jgi:hypothetical protein
MNRLEKVRYEMFLRVLNFGTGNSDLFPGSSPAGQSLAVVAKASAAIDAHATAKLAAGAEARKAKSRTRAALKEQMKVMSRTVRGLALGDEGLVKRLRIPTQRTDVALLNTAQFFIQEAEVMKDRLVQMGLPPTFVTTLRTLVETLETTSEQQRSGVAGRASAQEGLTVALDQGFQAIRTLDVIVVNLLQNDPMRLAAWKTARRLPGQSKASSTHATLDTPAPADAPASTTTEPAEGAGTVLISAETLRRAS